MWKESPWAMVQDATVVRRKTPEKEQEELLVAQIRLATHTKAAPLYLLFTLFPDSGEKMLKNSHLVNKATGALNTITQSLLAMVNDRYTLICFH